MSDLDRKLLFVTGKGGVGKTTVSVALAQRARASGRRVLLALTEGGQAARQLGVPAIGDQIEQLSDGLHVVLLEPRAALREYAEMSLPPSLVRALLDNRYSRSFLSAVPGLYPWACLGKAWYHSTETVDGRDRFDSVIIDAPATGHGLEMLRVPRVISEAAAPGILKRDAEQAWAMITDPARTSVVVVSLPEELPMLESLELIADLRALGLELARYVLNGRLSDLFTEQEPSWLGLDSATLSADAQQVLAIGERRLCDERAQAAVEAKARQLGVPLSVLPWVFGADTPEGTAVLARALAQSQ